MGKNRQDVAHARLRAVPALVVVPPCVHTSVDAARRSACATGLQTGKVMVCALIIAAGLMGQTVGENKAANAEAPTFKATSQLVVETVVVKDSQGKAIEHLTAKDFSITEDGAAQTIRFF